MQLSTLFAYICIKEYEDVQLYQNSNIDAIDSSFPFKR